MADPQSVRAVLDDLRAEGDSLDSLVAGLDPPDWAASTPAQGWTIAHQIAHLAWTDTQSLLSVNDPEGFARELAVATRLDSYVDDGARRGAAAPPAELLEQWRTGRARLWATLTGQQPGARFPWYGPPMSTASMATGRLMETWAHGEDVADALGVARPPTDRLRHVVRIGFRARDFAFSVHGLTPPADAFRVELTAPDGDLWVFGPEDAAQRVTGPALDFCLLAVQRRHLDDVALRAEGRDAQVWLTIAQAFAGPPGKGRPAREGGLPGGARGGAGASGGSGGSDEATRSGASGGSGAATGPGASGTSSGSGAATGSGEATRSGASGTSSGSGAATGSGEATRSGASGGSRASGGGIA